MNNPAFDYLKSLCYELLDSDGCKNHEFKAIKNKLTFRGVVRRVIDDRRTYNRVYNSIAERYAKFSQATEVGFRGQPGLVGDIADISMQDLIQILRHIAVDRKLYIAASKKSAISPLFDKTYLMESVQGWNLRLHQFSPSDGAQGDEELPHFHRWTLASKIVAGGYNNKNYQEIPYSNDVSDEEKYYKYMLAPSADGTSRSFEKQVPFEVGMRLTKQTLFRRGDVRHFPIKDPHSVSSLSRHTGTTLTLAHTGKAAISSSLAYEKQADLTSKPLEKSADVMIFAASLHNKIAFLQLLSLQDGLLRYLRNKPASRLTRLEKKHLQDCLAPNYFETSFLPSLTTAAFVGNGGVEFSSETLNFLGLHLKSINVSSLRKILIDNQGHLQSGAFSKELDSWDQIKLGDTLGRQAPSAVIPSGAP